MLFIDFETSYAPRTPPGQTPHGLRTQTVPEYLHDPRTELLGAAVGTDTENRAWLDRPARLGAVLLATARNPVQVSAHNAAFDLYVWARFFPDTYAHMRERMWASIASNQPCLTDTLHLARYASSQGWLPPHVGVSIAALGEHYGLAKGDTAEAVAGDGALDEYAMRDIEIAQCVAADFAGRWPVRERALSMLHVLMSTPGPESLQVDAARLDAVAQETDAEREIKKLLRKDDRFAAALARLGVEPQYKTTPAGRRKLALAKNDAWMRELLAHPHSTVRKLAEARQGAGSNIDRTRAQRMLIASDHGRRALPLSVDYYRAHTGRSGGSGGLNPQNMPRGGPHRFALTAPPGHKLVVADASQIEVRVLAWLAGDEVMLQAFREGRDPYKVFAVDLYGLADESEVTVEQRRVAKSAVLGLGFGAGPGGFVAYCEGMGVPMDITEAERVVATYRRSRGAVVRYWRSLKGIEREGHKLLPTGRRMVYPDMNGETFQRPAPFAPKGTDTRSRYWHGLFAENETQATARDITLLHHAVQIAQRYHVVLVVHDEIICSVPEEDAEACLSFMLDTMSTPPEWCADIPLAAEGCIADNYGEAG